MEKNEESKIILNSKAWLEKIPEGMQGQVDHSLHYSFGKIEVIDAIEEWQLDFHLGNVVKYVARAQYMGSFLVDLQKAKWYLDRRIEKVKSDMGNGIILTEEEK